MHPTIPVTRLLDLVSQRLKTDAPFSGFDCEARKATGWDHEAKRECKVIRVNGFAYGSFYFGFDLIADDCIESQLAMQARRIAAHAERKGITV